MRYSESRINKKSASSKGTRLILLQRDEKTINIASRLVPDTYFSEVF